MSVLSSRYFKRMLLILSTCSLIPLLLFSLICMTLYGRSFTQNSLNAADVQIRKIDHEIDGILTQTARIAQTCAGHMTVKSVLSYMPGSVEIKTLKDVLDLSVAGRQDQLAVHVISKQRAFSSKTVPDQYQYDTFSQTELFGTIDSYPRSASFFHTPYTDSAGNRTVLSVIMPVTDYYDQFVGYVIVDLFSSAFQVLIDHTADELQCAVWFNGDLLLDTEPEGLPSPLSIRGMSGFSLTSEDTGIAEAEPFFYYWTRGAYNRLQRVYRYDASSVYATKRSVMTVLLVLVALMTALVLSLAVILAIRQSGPILKLVTAMDEVGRGNLQVRCEVNGKGELADLSKRFNVLIDQLARIEQERRTREGETRRLEIAALQAQINPHFIYNTLGAARSLIRLDQPKKAAEIITHLSNLLHANFQSLDRMIPLRDDIQLIQSYMTIENLRFNDRFSLVLDVPDVLSSCQIPSLLLQPVVENAVKHGLEPKPGPGSIRITARQEQEDVVITVQDDGVGISPDEETRLNASAPNDAHIGYLNVRRRIELNYGPGYSTQIKRLPQGTLVTLRVRMSVGKEDNAFCTPS